MFYAPAGSLELICSEATANKHNELVRSLSTGLVGFLAFCADVGISVCFRVHVQRAEEPGRISVCFASVGTSGVSPPRSWGPSVSWDGSLLPERPVWPLRASRVAVWAPR